MKQFDNAVERFGKIILNELKERKITAWVAGGVLRDYFAGSRISSDYDLFFPDQDNYDKTMAYFTERGAEIIWDSHNGAKLKHDGKTFDLIKKFFSSPQDTINQFDFTVCMFAVDYDRVYYGETAFMDLAKKQLMINKITYPASTISRAFRYYTKGFRMCKGEMKTMIESYKPAPKDEPENKEDENASSGEFGGFFLGID